MKDPKARLCSTNELSRLDVAKEILLCHSIWFFMIFDMMYDTIGCR